MNLFVPVTAMSIIIAYVSGQLFGVFDPEMDLESNIPNVSHHIME